MLGVPSEAEILKVMLTVSLPHLLRSAVCPVCCWCLDPDGLSRCARRSPSLPFGGPHALLLACSFCRWLSGRSETSWPKLNSCTKRDRVTRPRHGGSDQPLPITLTQGRRAEIESMFSPKGLRMSGNQGRLGWDVDQVCPLA